MSVLIDIYGGGDPFGRLFFFNKAEEKMSKIVEVQGLKIGAGQPKICVPVVAENIEEIKKQANKIMYTPADLVEFRADYLRRADDNASVMVALDKLREQLTDKPVLFTLRTREEGGVKDISAEKYVSVCTDAINSGKIELIDIEYMLGENIVRPLIDLAHEKGVKVILSNHDFQNTPSADEMTKRMTDMKEMGADIAKIAVMPHDSADVLALLTATENMKHIDDPIPVITVSMSSVGIISRIAGEVFGSAVTFAASGKGSAPGQIDADELDRNINTIHQTIINEREDYIPDRDIERNNIVLIGFMGTGKTTIAQKICEKTDYDIREIDELIEENMGMTITHMFEYYGEEYFRDLETEMVREVSSAEKAVISCGGGTVMRPQNVRILKSAGKIILLRAKPETILDRVRKNGDKRPLLNKYQSRGYISWLMKKRSDVYTDTADYVIDVDGRSADAIAEEIIKYMEIN
jgi:3-dehydroquinate dehydratase type I